MIGRPLMVIPRRTILSRVGATGGPVLFGPSPEMSIVRLSPTKPLRRNRPAEKASADEIDVLSTLRGGAPARRRAKARAAMVPSMSIQGTTTRWRPGEDHST